MQPLEKGFYYHNKHNPDGPINNCAYELLGMAFNTEAVNFHSEDPNDFLQDEVVVYRPLFSDSLIEKAGRDFWIRPAHMFLEQVEKDGELVSRFQKITDSGTIQELEKIRNEMYGNL